MEQPAWKRERKERKRHTEQEDTQIQGATLNGLTADMAAVAHEGRYSYTERYQPSLSLFGRAEKKRNVSCSYFAASEVTQVGSREKEGV